MTLVDTSAWVEYLRATGSPVHHQVRNLLGSGSSIHTTDVVVMEVLAGGRDEAHTAQLRRLLSGCEFIATRGLGDFEEAAALYRRCRRGGETVRALTDCLVGAVAVRTGVAVLQAHRDFDVLARHTPLQLMA
ncbi:MAG TPA: PIN domain nuclease [Acidimicrobiales bacterium]|nr:PIN domain nuclease [Acidimicrobiales bacterium]